MEMPKPSAGHRELAKMIGEWEGEEKMYPSPWDPKGGSTIGRMKCRMALNGFALLNDYEQERDGAIAFTGHGVFTFHPEEQLYWLTWFDCMGMAPETFKGSFDGDVLRLAHGGPDMHVRLAYDLSEEGYLGKTLEMSPDGGSWSRLFDGRLKRSRIEA